MARTAVGYFRDRASAGAALDALASRGFSRGDISVLGRGRAGHEGHYDEHDHLTATEGAATGGIVGLLLGAAATLIPGIGPIVAVGPISAALAGAVTGGVTGAVVGGITGALVDAGVDEDAARYYDVRFREGGLLVAVRTDDARYDDTRAILAQHGADVRVQGTSATGAAPGTRPVV
jgi:hypothetical protein